MSEQATLAVIGAGPKAAAIASRIVALRAWQVRGPVVGDEDPGDLRPAPVLHIFEKTTRPGAHWDGRGTGYTDGLQELCTDPDRDVTHPSSGSCIGDPVDLTPFRWTTFLGARASPGAAPTHRLFADYVAWVLTQARNAAPDLIHVHLGSEVTGLQSVGDRWQLETRTGAFAELFDGVVVSSPGGAFTNRFEVDPLVRNRLFDAQTYWSSGQTSTKASIATGEQIAVIGAGGAAAAICLDLLGSIPTGALEPGGVVMIAPQPTLFSRGDSAFENELLSSPDWRRLPREVRRQVVDRLVSGVVFSRVLRDLEALTHMPEFVVARALAAVPGTRRDIELWCIAPDERVCVVDATWVIDASGFDATWFLKLLPEPQRGILRRLGAAVLAEKIDEHLRLTVEVELVGLGGEDHEPLLARHPGLHVPFLAGGRQAPGYSSLLQLGAMADQILIPYIR